MTAKICVLATMLTASVTTVLLGQDPGSKPLLTDAVYCKISDKKYEHIPTTVSDQFKAGKEKHKFGSGYYEITEKEYPYPDGRDFISNCITSNVSIFKYEQKGSIGIAIEVIHRCTETKRKAYLVPYGYAGHQFQIECNDDLGNSYKVQTNNDKLQGKPEIKIVRIDGEVVKEYILIERPVPGAKSLYIDLPGAIWAIDSPERTNIERLKHLRTGLKIDLAMLQTKYKQGAATVEIITHTPTITIPKQSSPSVPFMVHFKNTGDKPVRQVIITVDLKYPNGKSATQLGCVAYDVSFRNKPLYPGESMILDKDTAATLKLPILQEGTYTVTIKDSKAFNNLYAK